MNNATSEYVDLGYCVSHGKRITDREFDIHDLAELSDFVIRQTKAVWIRRYLLQATVKNKKIHLPIGCSIVESVTDQRPINWWGSNVAVDFDNTNMLINYAPDPTGNKGEFQEEPGSMGEPVPLKNDFSVSEIFRQGDFVPFDYDDHDLIFQKDGIDVDVVLKKIVTDQDGYPYLTIKGADALIYYANYIEVQKEYFRKIADIYMFREAERLKRVAMSQARVPDSVTDNQWNNLLNSMTTHNRKRFNVPFRLH